VKFSLIDELLIGGNSFGTHGLRKVDSKDLNGCLQVEVFEKETAISDPSKGGIYLMDQKTCQEVLLEAKGGNAAKQEFLKSFDAGTVDEIQAALSSTPVIHGISGEILDDIFAKLPDASVKQVLHQAELRIAAMKEVMKAFQEAGGDLRKGNGLAMLWSIARLSIRTPN